MEDNVNGNARMMLGRIDVTKIEKRRLYHGEKGTYLDVKLIPLAEVRYGQSHMIVQQVTSEEHEKGIRGPILGNCKPLEDHFNTVNLESLMVDAKT